MKKINVLLPMAAAAVLALSASCSSDETVEVINSKKPINFNVRTENSMASRAAKPITTSNLTDGTVDFEVWGFQPSNSDYYVGQSATDGAQIKHSSTQPGTISWNTDGSTGYWDYATPDNVQYWNGNTITFYAISPAHDDYTSITQNVSKASQSFTYYADNSNNSNQRDVMFATTSASASPVSLPFNHTLAQIVFMGKVEKNNMTATVENIKLHNIKNGGICTYDANTKGFSWSDVTASPAQGTTTTSTQSVVYTATPEGTGTITGETAQAITGGSGDATPIDPLLLRPQTFEGTGEATTTEPTSGAYLEVSYKLQNGRGVYIKGSSSDYAKMYVPLAPMTSSWEAGKKYIYTLSFDANAITFTCTVNDWTDSSASGSIK